VQGAIETLLRRPAKGAHLRSRIRFIPRFPLNVGRETGTMEGKRKYHHGALKQALLDAALQVLAEEGAAALTLTELARRVGVTPAASYRHYGSLDALMAELARRGFETFGRTIEAAWDEGRPDPATALLRMGAAYLRFARAEPALYAAMFRRAETLAAPAAGAAADHALEILWRASVAFLQPRKNAGASAKQLALQIWGLAHGVAMLAGSRHLRAASGVDPEQVLEQGLRGLMDAASAARP
jgi:AcrR family transcriptional regulator